MSAPNSQEASPGQGMDERTGAQTGGQSIAPITPAAPPPTMGAVPGLAPTASPSPAPAAGAVPAGASPSGYAAAAQARAASALEDAGNAPDRTALALQSFKNLTDSGEAGYQQNLRDVENRAAKLGRIGAGMTTSELNDVTLARQRSLDTTASQLATDAAGQTMADRLALGSANLGQFSAFQGADSDASKLALDTELGRGNLDVARQNAASNAASVNLNGAELALKEKLGLGDQQISRDTLAQRAKEAGMDDDYRRIQADRDYLNDDRTAEALAAGQGTDLSTGGLVPGYNGATASPLGSIDAASVQAAPPGAVQAYVQQGLASGQLDPLTAQSLLALAGG